MKVIAITNNLFDVFWQNGWENCCRIKKHKGSLVVVRAWKKPPRDLINALKDMKSL